MSVRGATAHVVVTDLSQEAGVEQLVADTLTRWGRIDVWVNNAGATMFAHLDQGEFAAHRQVLETNLFGPMYAARLLIPIFRQQEAGTLINVGSVLSDVGQPFVPSYVISKFGLHGLSEAMRAEFGDLSDVHVCTILPYATDTPHFETGANAIGRRAHAMPPTQDPDVVAAALVDLAVRPRRQRYVPHCIALGVAAHWLWPRLTERLLLRALSVFHLVGSQPTHDGSLYAPMPVRGTIHGTRGPVISAPALVAWLAADTVRRGWHALARQRRRWPLASTR